MTNAPTNTPFGAHGFALWTAAEAAAATGGAVAGDWSCMNVSIDSRTVAPGDLFIALAGPSFDGHDFVAQALEKGAAAAMVHRVPDGLSRERLLVVGDTLAGLQDLGRAARERLTGTVIGVTGSVGKTSTKEMLRLACGALGPVVASVGSFNNHWGLPLSLARTPRETAWCVLEMGMNHAGEIRALTAIARPHVALITAVEAVHIEFFDSVRGIAAAKAEIMEGIVPGGTVVLPRDNAHYPFLSEVARDLGVTETTFGEHEGAAARLLSAEATPRGMCARAEVGGEALSFLVGCHGHHWALNGVAALEAVRAAGGDARHAALALEAMEPPAGRGRRQHLSLPGDRGEGLLTLVDESYNASPVSMRAALGVLREVVPEGDGRRIAVLGDMRELGDRSDALHAGLADVFGDEDGVAGGGEGGGGIHRVYTCGPHMARLHAALPETVRADHAPDSTALAPIVAGAVRGGDVVMVKGSLGSRMAVVLDALRALDISRVGDKPAPGNDQKD